MHIYFTIATSVEIQWDFASIIFFRFTMFDVQLDTFTRSEKNIAPGSWLWKCIHNMWHDFTFPRANEKKNLKPPQVSMNTIVSTKYKCNKQNEPKASALNIMTEAAGIPQRTRTHEWVTLLFKFNFILKIYKLHHLNAKCAHTHTEILVSEDGCRAGCWRGTPSIIRCSRMVCVFSSFLN